MPDQSVANDVNCADESVANDVAFDDVVNCRNQFVHLLADKTDRRRAFDQSSGRNPFGLSEAHTATFDLAHTNSGQGHGSTANTGREECRQH